MQWEDLKAQWDFFTANLYKDKKERISWHRFLSNTNLKGRK